MWLQASTNAQHSSTSGPGVPERISTDFQHTTKPRTSPILLSWGVHLPFPCKRPEAVGGTQRNGGGKTEDTIKY